MKIINQTKNKILAEEAITAATVFKRMKGLLGERKFPAGKVMVIRPCNSIHTFFMHFPIDAVFVDKDNRVVKVIPNLKPWRLTGIYLSACFCIELPAGTLAATSTSTNDLLSFSS